MKEGIEYLVGVGVFSKGQAPPERIVKTREVKPLLPGELPLGYDNREVERQREYFGTPAYQG